MSKSLAFVAICLLLAPGLTAAQIERPPKPSAAPADGGPFAWASETLEADIVHALATSQPMRSLAAAGYRTSRERAQVVIDTTPGRTRAVAQWLRGEGAGNISVAGTLVQADVGSRHFEALARRPDVHLVRRPEYGTLPEPPRPRAPKADEVMVTEALTAMNAPQWHDHGILGDNVKIGVVDIEMGGWEALVGSELPEDGMIHFQKFGAATVDEDEVHGTACAEIVHDIAPSAEIYLALVASEVDLANAVDWMLSEGVRAVTMSVSWMSSGPGDGTGSTQDIVEGYVAAGGLWFNSAGNYRSAHWAGPSHDADGDGWVETATGQEIVEVSGRVSADTEVRGNLMWNDWTDVDQDYSFHLFKTDGSEPVEVDSSDRRQSGGVGQRPYESITYTAEEDGTFGFGVFRKNVTDFNDMEIFSMEQDLQDPVAASSVTPPGDSPHVMAAAALSYSKPNGYRSFSSAGPANGPGGSAEGGHTQPEIGGYDGVSTASYGVRSFYGTSAASPHVAGAAALLFAAHPEWTAAQVRIALEERAIDKGEIGMDNDYGWGRLSLGASPGSSCDLSVTPTAIVATDAGGSMHWVNVVSADAECYWTAESQASWIEVLPDSRTGTGIVAVQLQGSTESDMRQGSVLIAGQLVTVVQPGTSCGASITPNSEIFASVGGSGAVSVTTGESCSWTAQADASWITVVSGASGAGNGTVEYRVDANPDEASRVGSLTVSNLILTVTQQGTAESHRYLVAGVAATEGSEGTSWRSNLAACNLTSTDANLTMFYRHGGDAKERMADVSMGELVEWQNVVTSLFNIRGDSAGAVEVWSPVPLIVSDRTFNATPLGTYGQYLPGNDRSTAVTGDDVGVLSQIKRTGSFRTNIGFTNFAAVTSEVSVRLFDASGSQVGNELFSEVPPAGWAQLNQVFVKAGVESCPSCYALVDNLTAGSEIWAYASVVDNSSGDPTTVPVALERLEKVDGGAIPTYLVAGVAQAEGAEGTSWKTDLAVCNLSGQATTLTLDYHYEGNRESRELNLAHGGLAEWQNVVATLFEVEGDSSGAVELSSEVPVVVTSRTYNDTPDGTFGQFIPGIEKQSSLGIAETGVLSQIKRTDDFRTNIGFTNYGDASCRVRIKLFDGFGAAIGDELEIDVPPSGWRQLNQVFEKAGVDECQLGYALVDVLTDSGSVWAYASVVDNTSGDPTTVPLTR